MPAPALTAGWASGKCRRCRHLGAGLGTDDGDSPRLLEDSGWRRAETNAVAGMPATAHPVASPQR
ncbi:hypothetical protein CJ014_24375 [Pleomorphomonas carboxyditropha]|uniref:Uncharacterized protein n=1 Tax=Pleomorphomonas carboxyditropha TaxID=2023338 RepID=A0A2G9WQU3_9HYPH|nr:hypothetical protein CJ014_24375 [Pleomorphomonas carboxyditropha]